MNTTYFNFKINEDISTTEVVFSGELKGLTPFQTEEFLRLQKKVRLDAESKIIFLNLHKVTFWDTEGMRQTIKFAEEINKKIGYPRVVLLGDKDGYLIKRAVEKYPDLIGSIVPWFETADEVV